MNEYITVRIKRPDDGSYDDVCPELVLIDFLENPKAWEVELVPEVSVPLGFKIFNETYFAGMNRAANIADSAERDHLKHDDSTSAAVCGQVASMIRSSIIIEEATVQYDQK